MAGRLGALVISVGQIGHLRVPSLPSWRVIRRRLYVVLALGAILIAGYVFWFRDSAFVAVEEVRVSGAESNPGAEASLVEAGRSMSTLDLDQRALQLAVAEDPSVLSIEADADFPHGLEIAVDLREPAAFLEADGGTVVAGDGVVLATGVDRPDGLPSIDVPAPELSARASGSALELAQILGPVPDALGPKVEGSDIDPELGPVVTLEPGIVLRFGDSSQAAIKWDAAAAVLADAELVSATYIDLSAPARPVVG